MARKPRVISAPQARGGSDENGWIQRAGTMGNLLPDGGPIGHLPYDTPPDGAFEAPDDVNYDRVFAERERELGLPAATAPTYYAAPSVPTPRSILPGPISYSEGPLLPMPEPADLTALPDKFSLSIERKDGIWKVTSPGVHGGLWKAGPTLPEVVAEALAALAEMVRIDGVIAKGRRK